MEKKLPEFKPLPELGNVASNYMSAFNVGMNIYEALAYLQGYVQVTYSSQKEVLDDWNNLETWVQENLITAANEKTQEILQGWLDDGTLAETIKQSAVWSEKVDVAGDTMTGDLQFAYNHGLYNTSLSGDKVGMIVRTNNSVDEYTQIGDDNSKAVIHSESQPVWSNNGQNKILLTQEDLDTLNNILAKAVYFKTDGDYDTFTDENGDQTIDILTKSMVIDNLTSSLTNQPLSAKQGKQLQNNIESVSNELSGNISSLSATVNSHITLLNHIKKIIIGSVTTSPEQAPQSKIGYRNLWTYNQINSMFSTTGLNNKSNYQFVFISNNNNYSVNGIYRGSTYGVGISLNAKSTESFTLYYMGILLG